jgi:sarcosine oxidase subunit alpha
VCDVSTLGKIDIQGQDAARFLDFIYTNTMSTLPEGRVRYGIMLREDGHVLDDGTTAHLGPNHYLMTTTTSAASQVMRHLDFVHQAYCADWDLSTISVTENWAQFAIAGPKARALIESLSGQPLNLSFMGFVNLQLSEIVARVFRISFSGEESYELAVPARYGASLWHKLIVLAKTYEGGPYGMEALNVLRIEKGLLTHAEMHGRVTAFDLGLSSKMSSKKDFIGRAAAGRAGLLGPGREELVGLIAPVGRTISAGAHLYPTDKAPVRENDQGYVTSACYSPTLGRYLALAFLRDGREKQGQEIRLVDHLRDLDVLCQVENPVFYDNTGERLRG